MTDSLSARAWNAGIRRPLAMAILLEWGAEPPGCVAVATHFGTSKQSADRALRELRDAGLVAAPAPPVAFEFEELAAVSRRTTPTAAAVWLAIETGSCAGRLGIANALGISLAAVGRAICKLHEAGIDTSNAPPEPGRRGLVYVAKCSSHRLTKIGWTGRRSTRPRMAELSKSEGATVYAVHAEAGSKALELAAHEEFADHRVRGEWFDVDAGDVARWLEASQ